MNDHSDLYLLLHNFVVQMIPFKLEKFKKIQREKRYGEKRAQSLLHDNANYDLKNKNSHKL